MIHSRAALPGSGSTGGVGKQGVDGNLMPGQESHVQEFHFLPLRIVGMTWPPRARRNPGSISAAQAQ
jgi:hypothetical protein